MTKYDVVYILKEGARPDELRYSLRSIEANMTHGDVWFYCGQPKGLIPDHMDVEKQTGSTKWMRARSSVIRMCKNKMLTKKVWLFNDDFYVLKKMEDIEPLFRGMLRDHILDVEKRHGCVTEYTGKLRECESYLKLAGLPTLDYTLHIPMLVDRQQMYDAIMTFPNCPMFRSLYGNYARIGGSYHADVKVLGMYEKIDTELDFLSSSDISFRDNVQRFLEDRFPEPCKYEV